MKQYKDSPRKRIEKLLAGNNVFLGELARGSRPEYRHLGLMGEAKKMLREEDAKIPVLKGFTRPNSGFPGSLLIKVWCPYCRSFHQHGLPGGSKKKAHRVAHCFVEDSPFKKTGYFIQPFTAKEQQEMTQGGSK